jgi:hypothetical protein
MSLAFLSTRFKGKLSNEERLAAGNFLRPVGAPMINKALTAKSRNALGRSSFALPGGRYPINDANHARNALARVAQHGTPEEKAKVKAAVHRKFPGIGGS